MKIKDLRSLVKIITDTDITEFEIENAEEKILIKRGPDKEYVQFAAPMGTVAPAAAPAPAAAGYYRNWISRPNNNPRVD